MHKLTPPARVLEKFGQNAAKTHLGEMGRLFFLSMGTLFANKGNKKISSMQIITHIYEMGVMSLPLIMVVGSILGTVLITNTVSLIPRVGFGNFFGNLMVIAIVRELGPILTAFLIAGRNGSSLTTRIANMKVNSEIDALKTLGIDPLNYLIMPVLIGGMIAMLLANLLFGVSAIGAGFLITKIVTSLFSHILTFQLEWEIYFYSILEALSSVDFIMTFFKPVIFSIIIVTNSCYYGMNIKNDQREVSAATSKSVVSSFIFIVIFDLLLSFAYILDYIGNMASII